MRVRLRVHACPHVYALLLGVRDMGVEYESASAHACTEAAEILTALPEYASPERIPCLRARSSPAQAFLERHPQASKWEKQMFFLSYAQIWCGVQRPKAAQVHSHSFPFRACSVLRQSRCAAPWYLRGRCGQRSCSQRSCSSPVCLHAG